jgi:transcriptional regulator with XRE-family HTH domain
MTLAQQFADWLADAMRRAQLDIDRQQGGGRVALANKLGVSRSTVSRWLDGKALPSPEYFQPIADAVGVPVAELLIGAGIVSAESLNLGRNDTVAMKRPEEVADDWELLPKDRPLFFVMARELMKRAREADE